MMESFRIPFENDDFGKPIYARVTWSKASAETPRAIGRLLIHTARSRFAETLVALIYHAGGLLAGSYEIVPKPHIDYLCSKGFVVVTPNYRLVPQVTGKQAFADCEEAFDWATGALPGIMHSEHNISLDADQVVAIGHSSGGTMALHLASCKPVKAVTAFCPFIFVSDTTTNAHKPTTSPPFGSMPDFTISEEDWVAIKPAGHQISEAPMPSPDAIALPRNRWTVRVFKTGQWMTSVQPDGDFAAIDPMTRINGQWPPVMIIHGSEDYVPGRSIDLVRRAEKEMIAAGVENVKLIIVEGGAHLFDHAPSVGTTDLGPRWQAVVRGLDWLDSRGSKSEDLAGSDVYFQGSL